MFDGGVVVAEVASEPQVHQRGLMFRRSLGRDAGMLFVFTHRSRSSFFMKNTLIPLSIAFIERHGNGGRVVSILDMEPCKAEPCRLYTPDSPYDWALEVNKGWFARHGVEVGAVARLKGSIPSPAPPQTYAPVPTGPPSPYR